MGIGLHGFMEKAQAEKCFSSWWLWCCSHPRMYQIKVSIDKIY